MAETFIIKNDCHANPLITMTCVNIQAVAGQFE